MVLTIQVVRGPVGLPMVRDDSRSFRMGTCNFEFVCILSLEIFSKFSGQLADFLLIPLSRLTTIYPQYARTACKPGLG